MFPANGSKPIFIWWYTKDNRTAYVVNFKGIWEYATINLTEFSAFKRKYGMTPQLINETLIEPEIEDMEGLCEDLDDIIEQATTTTSITEDLLASIQESNSTLTAINSLKDAILTNYENVTSSALTLANITISASQKLASYIEALQKINQTTGAFESNITTHITTIMLLSNQTEALIENLINLSTEISREENVTEIQLLGLNLNKESRNLAGNHSEISKQMKELYSLLNKQVTGGLINASVTASLKSLEELNASVSPVFDVEKQLKDYLTQTCLSYINVTKHASLMESFLENCQSQLSTYLETIKLLQATAVEFGENITAYVEKIEDASARLNSSLSEIRSLSASLSAETNVTKTNSTAHELCSKMNDAGSSISELTEHMNEMCNHLQNCTGPGSNQIAAILANCSTILKNLTSSFNEIFSTINMAASNVESMLESWNNATECSSFLKNMSSKCLDGFNLFKSKPMEVEDAVRQLASNVARYAEEIVQKSESIDELITKIASIAPAVCKEKNITNLSLTFQDLNNETTMLSDKTSEIKDRAETLNNYSITYAGANSSISNETKKFLLNLDEFEEAVNTISETKNKLAYVTEEINSKRLSMQHECGNLLEHTEKCNETLSIMKDNINDIKNVNGENGLNLTVEIDTMIKIHHEIEVLAEETSKMTLQLNETTLIDTIQILSENLTQCAKTTLEKSQELHQQIERLCDEISQIVSDTETRVTELQDMVEMWNMHLRSPFLPFHSCKWNLTEVTPIVTADDKEIGLAFAFILEKSTIPEFNFTEGNIILRCRLYYVPVLEYTEHATYTVTKAELKMDFIILKWEWASEKK